MATVRLGAALGEGLAARMAAISAGGGGGEAAGFFGEGLGGAGGFGGAEVDADGFFGVGFECGGEFGVDVGFGFGGIEEDVAAGDVGADGFEAGVFAEGDEVGHGEFAGAADVDGAEEGDVGGHGGAP